MTTVNLTAETLMDTVSRSEEQVIGSAALDLDGVHTLVSSQRST